MKLELRKRTTMRRYGGIEAGVVEVVPKVVDVVLKVVGGCAEGIGGCVDYEALELRKRAVGAQRCGGTEV